jgi:hypothetical protein
VKNVDTNSTAPDDSAPSSLRKKLERSATVTHISRTQSLKSITNQSSENLSHLQSDRCKQRIADISKLHTIISMQVRITFQ